MHHSTPCFAGIDWAMRSHVVCVIDTAGATVEHFEVAHDSPGLHTLSRRFARLGVVQVAIERPDGPVVDHLVESGFEVVVVPSRSVKALRARYSLAGNKSDRADAYMLADVLRTDGLVAGQRVAGPEGLDRPGRDDHHLEARGDQVVDNRSIRALDGHLDHSETLEAPPEG